MSSKYNDLSATIQVIGCVFNNPQLLDNTDKYILTEDDFPNKFHQVVFGAIYKLYELGTKTISLENILDFLSSRPKSEAIFKCENGESWLLKASDAAMASSFDYYYNRMKKMTLLRAYDSYGIDVSDIYDPDNILDTKRKQLQEENLDNSSLLDLANKIDAKIENIKSQYLSNEDGESYQAGEGTIELVNRLAKYPEVGVPLYGSLINTVTRGARLKKFYLRSAPTGCGKSRTMIADACYIGCNRIYDETFGWINNGTAEPVLYITTEQEIDEVQTMMLAFLACVNEEHILNGKYDNDEYDRVIEACKILQESPIYIEVLPDFSLQDVEDKIKKHIRDHDVKYVVHDYIHTSLKILEEITRRSGGVRLREDNILFMLAIRLKDICNKYGVFILSATQLNSNYVDSETPDQNLLRGAKAIADKIDMGAIMLPVKSEDLEALQPVLSSNTFDTPVIKMSIYKNRRGRYKSIYLWCKADLGCCRVQPMFATTYDYELLSINDMKIITEDEPSAF
jgi:replicative DNA helicase